MRIVVSGTHASGKSTLISDFALRHPAFDVLADPFELIPEDWDAPGAAMFAAQLRVSADRLRSADAAVDLIAERGPLDFLAYLLALDERTDGSISADLLDRARALTAQALRRVDVLAVLPLTAADGIEAGADEDLELRVAMNDILLDLLDDPDLIGGRTEVVEIAGSRDDRLRALEAVIAVRRGGQASSTT
ncbi:ATP-binding protein [Microbacterium sp. SSM24]|uniref:ATP-binding protein n=1 Tax=Microbacterium sp. SSM24 TaxID=2991714 RepID=UPI002225E308|nr:ATP-binding protein [Microbacterium sp. SSM24]MCW3492106.1 ATP-binding protein [Microbacterium sp. SSM24]